MTVLADANGLALATAMPRRRFGAPRALPGTDGADSPALAIAPHGAAAVGWLRNDHSGLTNSDAPDRSCCQRVHAVIVLPGGRRSATRTLSAPGFSPEGAVAVADDRRAAVAFVVRRHVRVATAGTRSLRGFSRARNLGPATALLHVWMVGATPHALVLIGSGTGRVRVVETYRRRGRVVRRLRSPRLVADLFDPGVRAGDAAGRFVGVLSDTDRRQHTLVQRDRSGRVRVQRVGGREIGTAAVALSPRHADGRLGPV